MKIQRYVAKDMRSCLAQVREALGSDAVILSSGRVGDEVEVVAAIDLESQRASIEQAAARAAPAPQTQLKNAVRSVDFRQQTQPKRASSQLSPQVAQDFEGDGSLGRPRGARLLMELP